MEIEEVHQEVLLAYFSNPGIQVHSSTSTLYPLVLQKVPSKGS